MTNIFPTDDAFAAGATAYGDHLALYVRGGFWAVATAIAHPTSGTNYSHGFNAADLYDVFAASNGAAPRYGSPSVNPASFLWRQLETSSNVVATLGLQTRIVNGSGHNGDRLLPTAFVVARAAGGTYDAATNSTNNLTQGYAFGWISDATREAAWFLIRITAGPTLTILDSRAFRGTGGLSAEIDATSANEIEIRCTTVAGNARIRGFYRVPNKTGGQTEVEVFDYTDSSGSKITGAGRCGFGMSGQFNAAGSPGGAAAALATFFQVSVAGTVSFRDEWVRAWRQGALAHSVAIGAQTFDGYSLLQSFAGDWFGPTAFDRKLFRSKVGGLTDRVNCKPDTEPTGSGAGIGGFLASQREPTDRRSQNRSVQVRFSSLQQDGTAGTTNPSTFRGAGIFVRCSGSGTPSTSWVPTTGYHAFLKFNDGGSPTCDCFVYRWSSGIATLLAELIGVSVSIDTDYTFRFDAYNQLDASGQATGSAVLRVFLAGVQVVLVAVDSSIDVTTAGTVVDGSSERVTEGALEGIYCFNPDGDKTIFLDTWAEGTLTNSLVGSEADQASIAVEDELQGGTVGTWSVPADWPMEEIPYRPRMSAEFESGHVRAGAMFSRTRRRFRVAARAIKPSERTTLLALFALTRGTEGAFNFTPHGEGAALAVHFADPRLAIKLRDPAVYEYDVELEELIA